MKECEHGVMSGGVVVMPTDTLYGLIASALDPQAVEKIYTLKKRDAGKPCIVLIAHKESLRVFNIDPYSREMEKIDKYWPGPNSIILPCKNEKFKYLHRGTETIAFRVPDDKELRDFIEEVGPIVAPSANIEGEPPAETIEEAKDYFGNVPACYSDGGKITGKPSTIISFVDGEAVIRE